MSLILVLGFLVLLPFGVSIIWGAPYLPAHKRKIEIALDGLKLRDGELLVDMGSGDGKVALHAARRGIKVIGYEINPWLCLLARLRCRKYKNVKIFWANFWNIRMPAADAVFVFGIGHIMQRLGAKLRQELSKGTRVASFAWPIPGLGQEVSKDDIFFYTT